MLLQLLGERHPSLAANKFFIAGESYAGVYVPSLAQKILDGNTKSAPAILGGNAKSAPAVKINLQGIMVGNGVTDPVYDGNALVPFAFGKSLIDKALHDRIQDACHGSFWNATDGSPTSLDEMDLRLRDLNIYDVLAECYRPKSTGLPTGRLVNACVTGHADAEANCPR
ncbi:peptidase S10, serine carboxypeptidase [Baffinella frigidus]|nr:peptidase S10, serine carboxypeptidase [Cryptophyta sp. CCMP2293]